MLHNLSFSALQRFSGLGQIKEAKEDTSNKGAFSIKLLEILCGTGKFIYHVARS